MKMTIHCNDPEFDEQAARKIRCKTMFELQKVTNENHRSMYDNSYKYDTTTIGYFDSVETAEKVMIAEVEDCEESIRSRLFTKWNRPFAYFIKERPIQRLTRSAKKQMFLFNPYDSIRSYDGHGKLICDHDYDDGDTFSCKKPFVGRDPATIPFHHGDIVQVLGYRNRIYTVIVFSPPISTKDWKERFGKDKSDGGDDCYLVLHIDHEGDLEKYGVCPDESKPEIRYVDTHDHPKSYEVFPLILPVPESHKKRLREKLEEHITIGRYSLPT